MCDSFVQQVESTISARQTSLVSLLDCTEFVADRVCTALAGTVAQTQTDNEGLPQDIAGRIALILQDILAIEGEDGEDLLDLEDRLREDFNQDSDARRDFDSGTFIIVWILES